MKLLTLLMLLSTSTFAQLSNCNNPDTVNVSSLSEINFNQSELFFEIIADSIVDNYTIAIPCESWSIHHDTINCTKKTTHTFNSEGRFILTSAHIDLGVCFCESCSKASMIVTNNKHRHYVSGKNCKGNPKVRILNKIDKTKPDWLQKTIKKGTSFNLNELIFYPNKSMFMKSSYVELTHLLNLMNTELALHIEIQGHVNGPKQKNIPAFQKLSENRAKAVYDYLVKNGIDQKRMTHAGFGNTKMLFGKPKNESEMKKNRRVEILIK
ncbi:MAG: outer membrane protein OmpA-like peptidoglycan-associated protein [Saprospiraceae bacterium]|jgi:outer membrane protein OmpA-like peptidoglycan-associated protein